MKFWGHKPYYAIYKPCTTETWFELNRGYWDFDGYEVFLFLCQGEQDRIFSLF
jgi:hypothetical protein